MMEKVLSQKSQGFWFNKLKDVDAANVFQYQHKTVGASSEQKMYRTKLSEQFSHVFSKLTNKNSASEYVLLFVALKVLLKKYSNEPFILSTPPFKVLQEDLSSLAYFVCDFSSKSSISELIEVTKQDVQESVNHFDYSLDKLISKLEVNKCPVNNMFDIGFGFDSFSHLDPALIKKFRLFFKLESQSGEFYLTIYHCSGYDSSFIEQLHAQYSCALNFLVENREQRVSSFQLLNENEQYLLFKNTYIKSCGYPRHLTMVDVFEARAKATPAQCALSFEQKVVSYNELNSKANQLAHYLKEKFQLQAESKVALIMDRSEQMVIAIWAILKTGAAYVPIDPVYPKERILFTVNDSGSTLLLTDGFESDVDIPIVDLNLVGEDIEDRSQENLNIQIEPSALAYVIYTSGTTGTPKGVLVEHRNLLRLVVNDNFLFDFNETDVWSLFHSICFDFSVWEMFGAFAYGGKVVVVPKLVAQEPQKFAEFIVDEKVTVLNQTPTMFKSTVHYLFEKQNHSLRYVIFGGEALIPTFLADFKDRFKHVKLINMYGITETTVHVTYKEIDVKDIHNGLSNIGIPLPTLNLYIMDESQRMLPAGIVGEIVVGGEGIARGYLNRDELTNQRFITNPYNKQERLYRSGDLGLRMADGAIQYIGRNDHQVKIRGYRIELGEIERQLTQHPQIKSAVVAIRQDDEQQNQIVAYLQFHELAENVREYLSSFLPDYMIPSYFVNVDEFPKTATGKIDIHELEKRSKESIRQTPYIAPQNEREEHLVKIWQDILKISSIGINDSFFELGGHSLKATRLISWIHEQYHVKIELRKMFENPTIKAIAALIETSETNHYTPIQNVEKAEYYDLTNSQKRLWVIDQLDENKSAYNMPMVYNFHGSFNKNAFENALSDVVRRYQILRTTFITVNGEPKQRIWEPESYPFYIENIDLRERPDDAVGIIDKSAEEAFDLENGPLLKAKLLWIKEDLYKLFINTHHIIIDAWSLSILIDEVLSLYHSYSKGKELPLKPLAIQYKDYSVWINKQLSGALGEKHRNYWLAQLSGELPVLDIPTDYPRPPVKTYNGASSSFFIEKSVAVRVKKLSKATDTTFFMIVLASVKGLLYKYTGQNDILVGSAVSGRVHKDLEDQIGFFVNTLPLRTQFKGDDTFEHFLAQVKHMVLEGFEHQIYPYDRLVEDLSLSWNLNRSPLFDVIVDVENTQLTENSPEENATYNQVFDDFSAVGQHVQNTASRFDLRFLFMETPDGIHVGIDYNTDLFSERRIGRLFQHYLQFLNSVLDDIQQDLDQVDVVLAEEKELFLDKTLQQHINETTLIELFEANAALFGNKTVLTFGEQSLTYNELLLKANVLAAQLIEDYQIGPESIVGILLPRSFEQMIAILAVLKSGAAFLPIDTQYPEGRITYILNDSEAQLLITTSDFMFSLDEYEQAIFAIDIQTSETKRTVTDFNFPKPNNLAYVIYTSGSTGHPKGVMVEHRSIVNTIQSQIDLFNIKSTDTILQFASISFDAAVSEIFMAMLSGATLAQVENETIKEIESFKSYLNEKNVTVITLPPSYLSIFEEADFPSLHTIITAGEAANVKDVNRFKKKVTYFNAYGPTETSICASTYRVAPEENGLTEVPIGKPIANTSIYLLDAALNLVPSGVQGDLYVGGIGLARGYLNQPELTNEHFIKHPRTGERIYKTGDRAKWTQDGELIFCGRKDTQVKVRGYRIELAEIDAAFQNIPGVKSAVSFYKTSEDGSVSICSYYVASLDLDEKTLRKELLRLLPEYMVPEFIEYIDEIPLTTHGKVDFETLRRRKLTVQSLSEKIIEDLTPTEDRIAQIWKSVLGKPNVGLHDDFFMLGGQSLKAIQVLSRIKSDLETDIKIVDFFNHPTIKELAGFVETSEKSGYEEIPLTPEQEYYPVSHAQKRLWMIEHFEDNRGVYNIPDGFAFHGKFDKDVFEKSLESLIDRHEVLRTTFVEVGTDVFQKVHQKSMVKIEYRDLKNNPQKENLLKEIAEKEAIEPFDLARGPLARFQLIQYDETYHILLFTMHHIITDDWSSKRIFTELETLYTAYAAHQENPLRPLRIQYKDFAVWQNQTINSKKMNVHKDYWFAQFADEPSVLELPTDFKRPKIKTYSGDTRSFTLSQSDSKQLKEFLLEQNTSVFMGLMAIVNVLFYKYSGQNDITIGTVTAGRNHKNLEDQVGYYLNTLPIRLKFTGNDSLEAILAKVKQTLLDGFEHESYPFDKLIGDLDLKKDLSRTALFDVLIDFKEMSETSRPNPTTKGEGQGVSVDGFSREISVCKFDLTFNFFERDGKIGATIIYNTDLFMGERIERLIGHFEKLIENLIKNPKQSVQETGYLTESEQTQFMIELNRTETVYPKEETIHRILFEQAAKTPNAMAVDFEGVRLTYNELDERSNQMARYIRSTYAIEPDDLIAVMLDRSEEYIVCLLAVLKAGAAYVPIDPNQPLERMAYILNDTEPKVLITQSDLMFDVEYEGDFLILDIQTDYLGLPSDSLECINTSRDLAYVMYTSGTSGVPKGVMIEHRNVVRLVKNTTYVDFSTSNILLQTGALTFDATTFEFWGMLLNGGQVCLLSQQRLMNPDTMKEAIESKQINTMWLTSSWFNQLLDYDISLFKGLKTLVVGGDKLSPKHMKLLLESYPSLKVVNGYGPTENTTFSICHPVRLDHDGDIPLGKPISNSTAYILDDRLQLVSSGVTGELYLGGDGLSRGYLKQPNLTEKAFIEHPFNAGERLYKTGDLATYTPDGTILFLGRQDHQVKIRGYRLELSEVENALEKHPKIKNALVDVAEASSGGRELIAYVVSDSITLEELRPFLKENLPSYMIPHKYKCFQTFPLTANGKTDRALLVASDGISLFENDDIVEAATEEEKALLNLWQDILDIEAMTVTANFFDLGGDSLKAVRLVSEINKTFTLDISLKEIFTYPSIREFACGVLSNEPSVKKGFNYAYTRVNEEYEETCTIIGLPLGGGYTFDSIRLAKYFKHPMYMFNIMYETLEGNPVDDSETLIAEFARQIQTIDHKGPIYMIGWSGGGNLAYEVCKSLEKNGQTIKKIILVDSFTKFNQYDSIGNAEGLREEILREKLVEGSGVDDFIKRILLFGNLVNSLSHDGKIEADISLLNSKHGYMIDDNIMDHRNPSGPVPNLIAKETYGEVGSKYWGALTNGRFTIHDGHGMHGNMLLDEYVEQNATVIKDIIFNRQSENL